MEGEFYCPDLQVTGMACGGIVALKTLRTRAPENVRATDGLAYDMVKVSWESATDIPDSKVQYVIYADNDSVGTVAGSEREFIHEGLELGDRFEYYVVTRYVPDGTVKDESLPSESDMGGTPYFEASDGEFATRTKLSWPSIAEMASDIRIERSVPGVSGAREELAILNKNATTYNDNDGISGYAYTYYLVPLNEIGDTLPNLSDAGYRRPDGTIRGRVTSEEGAGVEGVKITVAYEGAVPTGGPGTNCTETSYCGTTDIGGYYEIDNIYYFDSSNFIITPEKITTEVHVFTPASLERSLKVGSATQSSVDFTDENAITVSGTVSYAGETCGVPDVIMKVNGEDIGLRTQSDGTYAFTVSEPGTLTITPEFSDHTFQTAGGASDTTLLISETTDELNFDDITVRRVDIVAQGGCETPLGDSVVVEIYHASSCFPLTYDTVVNGAVLTIDDLPARDGYRVEITDIRGLPEAYLNDKTNILSQFESVEVDLLYPESFPVIEERLEITETPADTTILPDTMIVIPKIIETVRIVDTSYNDYNTLRFIYRSDIVVDVDFAEAGASVAECSGSPFDGVIVMEEGTPYPLNFEVYEVLPDGEKCFIDRGDLLIYDEAGDRLDRVTTAPILNGNTQYVLTPGQPDITESSSNSYQKYLVVQPKVDFATIPSVAYWILVEGVVSGEPDFVSGTPEIPSLILHDPPGDQSYAFVEQGTSVTNFTQISVLTGGAGGLYADVKFGAGGEGFGYTAKAGAAISLEVVAGRNDLNQDGFFTTVNFLENFSTSSLENFTGADGDVYIGSALNQTFALSKELAFASCAVDIDTILEVGLDGFATTFIYTEKHIRDGLLPNLARLMDVVAQRNPLKEEDILLYNRYRADSLSWAAILEKNLLNREQTTEAFYEEGNISISAGAELSRSYTSTSGVNTNYTYDVFVDTETRAGVEAELSSVGGYFESSLGAIGRFQYTTEEVAQEGSDTIRTVGYVISDNDLGDYLTFDVYRDPDYDVPIFRTVSGRTSCPPEVNTQNRDKPAISLFPTVRQNIPVGGRGLYRADISNLSASDEAREYAVRVISASNPDGAKVYLAGGLINFSAASVFVEPGQTVQFDLEVQAGPSSADYEDIEIMVYPPCEYELWQDGGSLVNADTIKLSAFFQSSCSPVELVNPVDQWLVNRQSNDLLPVTFGGYDATGTLQSLILEIKRDGEGYQELLRVPKDELSVPFHDEIADVSGLVNGSYTLRASAYCGLDGGTTRSSTLSGTIDRNSLAPYGIPEPADGFLRPGQAIRVNFDKPIAARNGSDSISLYRADTGEAIAVSVQINDGEVTLIPDVPLTDRPELKGVLLTAHVEGLRDESGNRQQIPVTWSFEVNVQPVFWDPEVLAVSTTVGMPFTFEATLSNDSRRAKTFQLDAASLDALPWLTAARTTGTILADGSTNVTFSRPQDLAPGEYAGEVVAIVDGFPVPLYVQLSNLAVPPNWHFDPEGYQYSMTIVTQFSLDETDAKLSTDTRDLIGAYVDGELRGLANIEYLPGPDLYRAFLTVHGNNAGGGGAEVVSFRFWRALTGTEYGALEETTFTADRQQASIASPLILHPAGTFQVIPLQVGWNWISFNVDAADMSRETIFQSVMGTNSPNTITIKSLQNTAEWSAGTGWQGNLRTLHIGNGYLVHLSDRPDTLYVAGTPVAAGSTTTVAAGWNWIGYPRPTPAGLDDALADLRGEPLDIIKSQTEFAEYFNAANGWEGSLTHLRPGEGYKLKVAGAGTITFRSEEYEVDPHAYEFNMNVTATLDAGARQRLGTGDWQLVALLDGQCRGIVSFEETGSLYDNRAFLLVSGTAEDMGRNVTFRLYDAGTGRDVGVTQAVAFRTDGLVGSVRDPYVISLPEVRPASLAPNPTTGELNFSYSLDHTQSVRLRLYDGAGRLIRDLQDLSRQESGRHTYRENVADLSAGVYFLEYVSEAGTELYRLIKH